MTPTQRALARHALGLPNAHKTAVRNYCVTPPDTDLWREWHRMVDDKLATVRRASELSDDLVFHLTGKGIQAALEKGERG